MAIVQTGTTLTFPALGATTPGTVSTAITVPADAEAVVVGLSAFSSDTAANFTGGVAKMTFTKGGVDTDMHTVSGGDAAANNWSGPAFWLELPDTGSNKTLKWVWQSDADDANTLVSVIFLKGIDTASPVRASGGAQAGAFPLTTGSLAGAAGDLAVAWVGAFASGTGSVDSWSNLSLLTQITQSGPADGAWATGSPTGSQTYAASSETGLDDGGMSVIIFKAAGGGTPPPNGWWNEQQDFVPGRKIREAAPPAIALTPATLPAPISGMAWFEPAPPERKRFRLPSSEPPLSQQVITQTGVAISGMAWFAPRDERPVRRMVLSDPPPVPMVQQPVTWAFLVGDTVFLRDPPQSYPPPFVTVPSAPASTIAGMAWFEAPDRDRRAIKVTIEAPPALSLTPDTLPVPIGGMGWFAPPDFDKRPIKVRIEQPPAVALNAASLPVPVSGMAWFAPPDRDKRAIKVRVEAPPAIALTPSTLPVPIRGMAWFIPPQPSPKGLRITWNTAPAHAHQVIVQLTPPATRATFGPHSMHLGLRRLGLGA